MQTINMTSSADMFSLSLTITWNVHGISLSSVNLSGNTEDSSPEGWAPSDTDFDDADFLNMFPEGL